MKLTSAIYRSAFCSLHFSSSCLAIWKSSIVFLSSLNKHWLSGINPDFQRLQDFLSVCIGGCLVGILPSSAQQRWNSSLSLSVTDSPQTAAELALEHGIMPADSLLNCLRLLETSLVSLFLIWSILFWLSSSVNKGSLMTIQYPTLRNTPFYSFLLLPKDHFFFIFYCLASITVWYLSSKQSDFFLLSF